MQATIDVTEYDLQTLTNLAKEKDLSSEQLIGQILSVYLREQRNAAIDRAFGIWKDRNFDGLEYQTKIRDEWPD